MIQFEFKFVVVLFEILTAFTSNFQLVFCLIIDDTNGSLADSGSFDSISNISNSSISNSSNTDHVCYREETYVEQVRIPVKQPVRIRLSNWCLEFPPRCSNYKTEIREVIKVQNETRTRTIEFCCEGYAEITSGNDTICKPICRGGCGKGFCNAPNECICDVGYTGRHCTQRCRHGQWGEKCEKTCKCRNNSICDSVTGFCECSDGWIGELCDQPCPEGFYGLMCKNSCECSSNRCNSQTGECILDEAITKLKPVKSSMNSSQYVIATSSEKPIVTTLKQITSTSSPAQISSTTIINKEETPPENATSSIIESLNSTIANLTENIDKLTKNLNKHPESVTLITVPDTIVEVTSPKSVADVIFIKPDSLNPAIIVHRPSNDDENIERPSVSSVAKGPEVIHVIANLQQPLKDTHSNDTSQEEKNPPQRTNHDWSAVLSVISIFVVLLVLSGIGFVILYRKYLQRQEELNSTTSQTDVRQDSKICAKPLPDLPAFTQNLTKTTIPEFYDRPSNNSVVPHTSHSYSYTTANGSVYSVASKSYPRKPSLEHLYDEIKYPSVHSTTSRF